MNKDSIEDKTPLENQCVDCNRLITDETFAICASGKECSSKKTDHNYGYLCCHCSSRSKNHTLTYLKGKCDQCCWWEIT